MTTTSAPAAAVTPETFSLTLPAGLDFRVNRPTLGPDLLRGMVAELASPYSGAATVNLHIRRNRRTVTIPGDAFLTAWSEDAVTCLDARYENPHTVTGFPAAVTAARTRLREQSERLVQQKAWKEVADLQDAAAGIQGSLNAARTLLERINTGKVHVPVTLGGQVTVCWACTADIYDHDLHCPGCRWRTCTSCGACQKGGKGPDCPPEHPESELYERLHHHLTRDRLISALEADLPRLEGALHLAQLRAAGAEQTYAERFPATRL